jgi:adenylylsulfate kinase
MGSGGTGSVVWLTGLPSSGKSLLATRVFELLSQQNVPSCVLDGDEVRAALSPAPGYDEQGRRSFYATLGQLAALLAGQGLVVLVPATANRRAFRDAARDAAPHFVEVFVDVPLDVCRSRDAKGLYEKAQAGEVADMPGADANYETPSAPDVIAAGGEDAAARERIVAIVKRARDVAH